MNKYGLQRGGAKVSSTSYGFKSGDMVKALIPVGKYAGTHVGHIAIRNKPSFVLNGFDVHVKYLIAVHRADGYIYEKKD